MSPDTAKSLPVVSTIPEPENFRKKRERGLRWTRATVLKRARESRRIRRVGVELKKRTLAYEEAYVQEEKELVDLKRKARKEGGFYMPPERRVVFCVRIKGIKKVPPTPKKILQLLNLNQIHNGRFIRLNKATKGMLKRIEPYVTYGSLSRSMIRTLIYKRGYLKVGKPGAWQRKKINDLTQISRSLGKYGIHGPEDMIREITTCGERFKEVNNAFWAFKLSSPKKGYKCKRHGFNEARGGDQGDRDAQMSKLIVRMA